MSTTNPVGTSAGSLAGTAASAVPANMQISQAQFLQLISTQMRNQNPLQPSDPQQFVAQLEGMSEVSSMQGVQTSVDALTSNMQAAQVLNGTSLLGHSVLAPGTTVTLPAGGTASGAVTAPTGAGALTVSVTDSSGALVKSFMVAPQASGLTNFTWDGTTATGAAAPPGQYTMHVNAAVGSSSQSVDPLVYSQVTTVSLDPSTQSISLNTPNGTIPMSSVVSIK